MTDSAFGSPLLIDADGKSTILDRVPLSGAEASYDEAFIQKLVFDHPQCLPIKEIDQAYANLIPICCELSTPAGPLDILFVTPSGRLCIVEAKLWRNPEARRKVVGQILDYAKELSQWDYEDLQREVSRATKRKGGTLFDIAKASNPALDQTDFVDGVTQSLNAGRFLLLIIGDGIREGVGAIAEFIESAGNLEFTFGLVEIGMFKQPDSSLLVQPRVLAKTVIVKRSVVSIVDGKAHIRDESEVGSAQEGDAGLSDRQQFFADFWTEFTEALSLDDTSQQYKPAKAENFYLSMPPSGSQAWISAYFAASKSQVGVYLKFAKGSFGDIAFEKLLSERDIIDAELDLSANWESKDGNYKVITQKHFANPMAESSKEEIAEFFADALNRYVNAFKPRLERIAERM